MQSYEHDINSVEVCGVVNRIQLPYQNSNRRNSKGFKFGMQVKTQVQTRSITGTIDENTQLVSVMVIDNPNLEQLVQTIKVGDRVRVEGVLGTYRYEKWEPSIGRTVTQFQMNVYALRLEIDTATLYERKKQKVLEMLESGELDPDQILGGDYA